jgi:hypothetical protein
MACQKHFFKSPLLIEMNWFETSKTLERSVLGGLYQERPGRRLKIVTLTAL